MKVLMLETSYSIYLIIKPHGWGHYTTESIFFYVYGHSISYRSIILWDPNIHCKFGVHFCLAVQAQFQKRISKDRPLISKHVSHLENISWLLIGFLSWNISILCLNIAFKFMKEISLCPPQIIIILIQIWGSRRLPSATLQLLAVYHSDDVIFLCTQLD